MNDSSIKSIRFQKFKRFLPKLFSSFAVITEEQSNTELNYKRCNFCKFQILWGTVIKKCKLISKFKTTKKTVFFSKADFPTAESHFIRKEQQSEKSETDTLFISVVLNSSASHCPLTGTVPFPASPRSCRTLKVSELRNIFCGSEKDSTKKLGSLTRPREAGDAVETEKWGS